MMSAASLLSSPTGHAAPESWSSCSFNGIPYCSGIQVMKGVAFIHLVRGIHEVLRIGGSNAAPPLITNDMRATDMKYCQIVH